MFLLVPFHFIVAMERDVREGKARSAFALLTGKRWGTAPQGAIYIRVWHLGLLLLAVAAISLALTANLFDNLKPGVYTNLFMQLVQWRQVLYFTLGMECLLWYYWSLNGIKRGYYGSR